LGYINYYSVVKVQVYRLTGNRRSKEILRASVTLQSYLVFKASRDKATQLIAGHQKPCDETTLGIGTAIVIYQTSPLFVTQWR
jgi:hypothetical protein